MSTTACPSGYHYVVDEPLLRTVRTPITQRRSRTKRSCSSTATVSIGALGVRWLASRRFMQNTRLGATLQRIGEVLTAVAAFLRGAFQLLERLVDVVIEGATSVVKKVASAASQGAQQVMAVCTDMATRAFREARRTVSGATTAAATLCHWVTGWFNGRPGWG
jgi:hypothetical protein